MTTILIVEDHSIVRESPARLLRLEGYRALCARDGNEALVVLRSRHMDLVLLDLMMPRGEASWRELPVPVLTGPTEGSTLQRARELNPTDVLTKARFTVDELFVRIGRIVGKGVQSEDAELAPEGRKTLAHGASRGESLVKAHSPGGA